MAGVGEAGAIVGLISTAASLSKAVIDIASKYKVARLQIESFGQEVGNLGKILGQLHHLYSKDDLRSDRDVISVIVDILDQCSGFFAELEAYRDTLYSTKSSVRNVTFRGKAKWVFEEKELEYLRTRVESMKLNMLLMMTMQCVHGLHRSNVGGTVENHAEQARILSIQSEGCAKRLQTLENDVAIRTSTDTNPVIRRTSIDTTASARSIMESILSLYGHDSLYVRPPESQGEALENESMQVDLARVSRIAEDYIHKTAVVDEDRQDSPFISPSASRLILETSTASDDQRIEDLLVEQSNHLAATELGIYPYIQDNLDQHQYDSERIVSSFFLEYTLKFTLKDSYIAVLLSAFQYYEKGKDWRQYELCITTTHRTHYLQLDDRPLLVDRLCRQQPFYCGFRLRRLVVPVPWKRVHYMLDTIIYTYRINRHHGYHEVLAAMLQAVNESLEPMSYAYVLCLSSHTKESTSSLPRDEKPLALYEKWKRKGRKPFFLIQRKDEART